MQSVRLDLRQPTFVIAGAFNAAIFVPSWIASKLFGIAEGIEVPVNIITDLVQQKHRPYIDEVAVLAESERLSVFIDDLRKDVVEKSEYVFHSICNTLPHTPVGGVGVNFNFVVDEPSDELIKVLNHGDRVDEIGKIITETKISEVDIGDQVLLNFKRVYLRSSNSILFNFNYHHERSSMEEIDKIIDGSISRFLDRSLDIVKELYGVEIEDEIELISALNKTGA